MSKIFRTTAMMLCLAAVGVLVGCEKSAEAMLEGDWSATSISETTTGHPDAEANKQSVTTYGDTYTLVYTFNSDHTGTAVTTVVSTEQSVASTFTYSATEKELTYRWESGEEAGRSITYQITSLDKTHLSYTLTSKVNGTAGDELGNLIPYTATTTQTYVFKRV